MKHLFKSLILAVPVTLMIGCGGSKADETEETKSTLGAFKEFADKAEELSKKEAVEPVSFQELKELLPTTLAGIPRTSAEGQSTGAIGAKFSVANGEYSEGDKSIRIDLMDLGGVGGFAAAGMAAWTLADSERETATGYEKTVKIDGHKAFEKYDNESKSGELKLLFEERYVLSIDAQNLSMDEIKSAYRQLDLSKLPK